VQLVHRCYAAMRALVLDALRGRRTAATRARRPTPSSCTPSRSTAAASGRCAR